MRTTNAKRGLRSLGEIVEARLFQKPPEPAEVQKALEWSLDALRELGRREGLDFKARAILRSDKSDRQKLQAIQKLMGWSYPNKRDPEELCRHFRTLRTERGVVLLSVRSGPRAPLHEIVEGCPLPDADALATLKRLYAANSSDAILQALHAAKRAGVRAGRLPARRPR